MPDPVIHTVFHTRRMRVSALWGGLLMVAACLTACTTEPVETSLLLPVAFSNVPDNMVLTRFHTDKIEIRIQGDPRLIEQINQENIQYPADLYTDLDIDPAGISDSIGPGHYVLPVDKRRIPVNPAAITILEIIPSYLSVRLENRISRKFKVTVPYVGEPAEGYIVLEPAPEPAEVTLSGAQSLMDAIDTLKTKPVDLGKAHETFKKEVPLDLENPQLYAASEPIIVVTVQVQEEHVEKRIEDIPIEIRNGPPGTTIEPRTITVAVKGPFAVLDRKETVDQIVAFIDLAGVTPGVYARHVHVTIPVGLTMTLADPQVFTVKIQ